jgi:tetratricopeptide (TPR) repeat protein
MPARLVMERAAWDEADTLTHRKSGLPFIEALTRFTRAVAFARSGKPEQAGPEIEALKAEVGALRGKDPYWMEQVDIQRQAAEGWVAFASGQQEEGIRTLQTAADREGATEKHVITPGPLAPVREQLGEMLLAAGRPAEALIAFQAVQVSEPNRFRAIYGTAHAAEQVGDRDLARQNYAKLLALAVKADEGRPELVTARAFAAAN